MKYKPKTKPNYKVNHHRGMPTKGYLESLNRLEAVRKSVTERILTQTKKEKFND